MHDLFRMFKHFLLLSPPPPLHLFSQKLVERNQQGQQVWQKAVVVIQQLSIRLELRYVTWSGCPLYVQKQHLFSLERALTVFQSKYSLLYPAQYFFQVVLVLRLVWPAHQDVIHVHCYIGYSPKIPSIILWKITRLLDTPNGNLLYVNRPLCVFIVTYIVCNRYISIY